MEYTNGSSGQDWELSAKSKNEREHERILKEIETTDTAFVGASLRAIYEGNFHESFLSRLDQNIKQHDRDIERLCNFHYNGFIESITELIQVRGDAKVLKNQVVAVNVDQQDSGKILSGKSEDLIQCRLQQKNIASVIDELTECLPVLQTYGKMQNQFEAKRYYSALKTLEKLENDYFPVVHGYRFCEIMKDNIPKIREDIKNKSKTELETFLGTVREKSSTVGKLAIKQAADMKYAVMSTTDNKQDSPHKWQERLSRSTEGSTSLMESDGRTGLEETSEADGNPFKVDTQEDPFEVEKPKPPERLKKKLTAFGHKKESAILGDSNAMPMIPPRRKKKKRQAPIPPRNDSMQNSNEDTKSGRWKSRNIDEKDNLFKLLQQDVSLSELIDFSPVYKCIHIYGILKRQKELKDYYCEQRQKQADIICKPPTQMGENLENYMNFLHQIAGFFIVEDYILHTADDLIDQTYINNLWNATVNQTMTALRRHLESCHNADTLLSVKNLIVVFADTMRAYGFSVDSLFSFLMELRERFGEILLKTWGHLLYKIFDEDNYTPMQINSETEALSIRKIIPLEDLGITTQIYPVQLPFSRFVPCVFDEIKAFTHSCLQYCRDLHLSSTEIDDGIRKLMNSLLNRTLSNELKQLVQKKSLGLTELVQITINISYLEELCKHLESYICSVTGIRANASHTKLLGLATFKDARSETEAKIYAKVDSKIDEFFELADYDWNLVEPKGTASSYLRDLIAYLKHNFKVFSHLPEKVAQTACMSACKHIGNELMDMLLDPAIKQISMGALHQYNLDVMQCEQFADSDPVPGFQDGALQMCFLDLRQLLELFLSWDWSAYLADCGSREGKYVRVPPNKALMLLEKIKEDVKPWNFFSTLNRQGREKKKLRDTVVKQLRAAIASQSAFQ